MALDETPYQPVVSKPAIARNRQIIHQHVSNRAWVKWLKILLPAFALSLLLLAITYPFIRLKDGGFLGIDFSPILQSHLDQFNIIDAGFSSTDKIAQPFNITAELVTQKDKQLYELQMPKADLLMAEGNWSMITAEQGLYQEGKQAMNLNGNVEIFHDLGYELYTSKMVMDFKSGIASGHQAVVGQSEIGQFTGEGFEISERGLLVKLKGKSQIIITGAQ